MQGCGEVKPSFAEATEGAIKTKMIKTKTIIFTPTPKFLVWGKPSQGHGRQFMVWGFTAILMLGVIFWPLKNIEARDYFQLGRIFKAVNLKQGQDFNLFENDFRGGVSVCAGDLNGDGHKEIVIGAGPGRRSEVRVYDHQGKKTNYVIYPFDAEFLGGVDVACGDVNGDQKDEIAVAVASRESAHIKVYKADVNKTVLADFFGEPAAFRGGVHIALADLDGDHNAEILVSRGQGTRSEVRVFKGNGIRTDFVLYPFPREFKGGVDVAAADVDGDKLPEIIVSAARQDKAQIKVYKSNGLLESSFIAFEQGFKGGADIATADLNFDGISEILAGAGPGGAPHVRAFNYLGEIQKSSPYNIGGVKITQADTGSGEERVGAALPLLASLTLRRSGPEGEAPARHRFASGEAGGEGVGGNLKEPSLVSGISSQAMIDYSYYPFEKNFRGGVNLAAADLDGDRIAEIIILPALNYNFNGPKKIVIDISEQNLKAYEGEKIFLDTKVSTGRYGMGTPLGNFRILSKNPRAWSSKYGLYMPYWMAFTAKGHGLHELPEWPNGYKEGANHLGVRVSHGCVRLGVGPAKQLYDWAAIGTPVIVQD